MFVVNLLAFGLCGIINFFTILYLQNLTAVLFIIDIVIIIKSVLLSQKIDNILNVRLLPVILIEAFLCASISAIMYVRCDFFTIIIMIIAYCGFYFFQKKMIMKGVD